MIDLIFYVVIILAIIQGFRKGLILGVFSLVCGIIGLAAAVKLSAVVAAHMKSGLHVSGKWVPVLAFIIVFIIVLLIIRWAGKLIEGLINLVLLGWLNKLGGMLLFLLLYLSIYSIILFYASKTALISQHTIDDSHFYSTIAPMGPAVIRFITGFIPYGQDMFTALEHFFDKIAHRVQD